MEQLRALQRDSRLDHRRGSQVSIIPNAEYYSGLPNSIRRMTPEKG